MSVALDSHGFKKHTGTTINEYLLRCNLQALFECCKVAKTSNKLQRNVALVMRVTLFVVLSGISH